MHKFIFTKKRFQSSRRILSAILAGLMFFGPSGFSLAAFASGTSLSNSKSSFYSQGALSKEKHPPNASANLRLRENYGHLPLSFEPNQGQADPQIKFLARGSGYGLFLTDKGVILSFLKHQMIIPPKSSRGSHIKLPKLPSTAPPDVLRLSLTGANSGASFEGSEELPGVSNYLIGKDSTQWHRNISHYSKVRIHDIYPGVDMVYYSNPVDGSAGANRGKLEYDFVVNPGADPKVIRMKYDGTKASQVDASGNLQLSLGGRKVSLLAPSVYQGEEGARTPLVGKYVRTGNNEVGFEVKDYDKTKPLIVDPVLDYSTYLGGSGNDSGNGIAVDSSGNAYVTGSTAALEVYYFPIITVGVPAIPPDSFPTTPGSFQPNSTGYENAFVSKMSPDGSTLIYSTYLGGSDYDTGNGIAVDPNGDAYVAGSTSSADFPTTPGAFQTVFGGGPAGYLGYASDAFFSELSPDGSTLFYSTYLGGNNNDYGYGIAVDGSGKAYVTGQAGPNFPTTAGAYETTATDNETFLAKINPAGGGGSDLLYSTYVSTATANSSLSGGAGTSVAVDSNGFAYLTGFTAGNFPTTSGAYQPTFGGGSVITGPPGYDAFMAKVKPAGAGSADLVYSTYLGGNDNDFGFGIALDALGNVFITGTTGSLNFPTTSGVFQANTPGVGGGATLPLRFQGISSYWFFNEIGGGAPL